MRTNVGEDDLILVLTFVVTHDVSTDQLSYPYNLKLLEYSYHEKKTKSN